MTTSSPEGQSSSLSPLSPANRQPGLDLLRITAMFMVCVLHLNWLTGGMELIHSSGSIYRWALVSWESASLVAVNLYGMLTGYLCVTKSWKLRRYLVLWVQVAFYTVLLYAVAECVQAGMGLEFEYLKGAAGTHPFFPIPLANAYGYFVCYTVVFFLIPYINPLLRSLSFSKYSLLILLIVSFGIFGDRSFGEYYNNLWIFLLYIVGAYFRLHPLSLPWYVTIPVTFKKESPADIKTRFLTFSMLQ